MKGHIAGFKFRHFFFVVLFSSALAACAPVQPPSLVSATASPARLENGSDPTLFRFVFTGDSRGDYQAEPPVYLVEDILAQIVGHILALKPGPEFVIFNGDMVAKTTFTKAPEMMARWRAVFQEPLQKAGVRVYTAPGNHVLDQKQPCAVDEICYVPRFVRNFQADNPMNGPAGYEGVTYSFTHENVHFVTATSFITHNGPDNIEVPPALFRQQQKNFEYFINRPNRQWLARDLARDDSAFTVFFTHNPLYPVGPHHKDMKGLHAYPDMRAQVAAILTADGVDIFLASHEHLYARSTLGPGNPTGAAPAAALPQVVVGAASAPLAATPARSDMRFEKYLAAYAFLVGDVKADRIEFRAYDQNAHEIDSFSIAAD